MFACVTTRALPIPSVRRKFDGREVSLKGQPSVCPAKVLEQIHGK
jgi:hypothetical protein